MDKISSPKYLLLDTNILQFSSSKTPSKQKAIISCLENLRNDGFDLATSQFSVLENLHGLWGQRAKTALAVLNQYEKNSVSENIFHLAAVLGGLYHDEKIDNIDTGDKIIAATAVLEKGYILTANHKDFPHPFFLTELYLPIKYETHHYFQTIDISVYKPNLTLILRRIKEKE